MIFYDTFRLRRGRNMATAVSCEPSSASLAQQLDEVQLLEAMSGREEEFKWRQDDAGRISGTLQVFLHLEQDLDVCVVRRERYVLMSRSLHFTCVAEHLCLKYKHVLNCHLCAENVIVLLDSPFRHQTGTHRS